MQNSTFRKSINEKKFEGGLSKKRAVFKKLSIQMSKRFDSSRPRCILIIDSCQ